MRVRHRLIANRFFTVLAQPALSRLWSLWAAPQLSIEIGAMAVVPAEGAAAAVVEASEGPDEETPFLKLSFFPMLSGTMYGKYN